MIKKNFFFAEIVTPGSRHTDMLIIVQQVGMEHLLESVIYNLCNLIV